MLLVVILRGGAGVKPSGNTILDNLPQRRAGLHLIGGQPIDLGIALIGYQDPLLAVEHAKAVRHVFQGRIEAQTAESVWADVWNFVQGFPRGSPCRTERVEK
jgi:hypothetical protein